MRVHYDDKVDAVYIKLGNKKPDGVIEIAEGVNLDTTSTNEIVGIEILDASRKMDLRTILSYQLDLDSKLTMTDTRARGSRRDIRGPKIGTETIKRPLAKSRR